MSLVLRQIFKKINIVFLFLVGFAHMLFGATDDFIASYGDLNIDVEELDYMVSNAPPTVQREARVDPEARYELLASLFVSKSILAKTRDLKEEGDFDNYYKFQFQLFKLAREFDEKLFQAKLTIPDLNPIALERYRASKEEIARQPETRLLSHILLLCTESCDAEAKKSEMEGLRQRLLEGESFSDLAAEFSQDPGSRQRGGQLSRPISLNDESVDEVFRTTAFSLSRSGDLSGIVKSRFGYHVVRLEKVNASRLYSFDEAKPALLKELEKRYRQDAYRAYFLALAPGNEMRINYPLVDEVLGPLPLPAASEETL